MRFRIKELREAKGLTQEELAAKSNVSRATICGLEGETQKTTTTKTLIQLADALGVSIETLFYPLDA